MQWVKKHGIFLVFISVILIGSLLPLPYYIYKPGSADPLNPVVAVEAGYDSEGDMHLVTIRGGRATPLNYIIALFSDYQDIYPLEEVFPEGYDRDNYMKNQLMMMESAQQKSVLVAFDQANVDYHVEYEGVYVVDVLAGMPAEAVLETGDKIIAIEGQSIVDADDLIEKVESYQVHDELKFTVIRDEESFETIIELVPFETDADDFGIGIQLVTNREVELSRDVVFDSGDIGGPSAGLALALEVYDQLTSEDITHALNIAATGEIDYDGSVHRIGGVDKKVVAADKQACDIFFVPNEEGREHSNYLVAKQTAEAIGSDMAIVPVDTIDDALNYLTDLQIAHGK